MPIWADRSERLTADIQQLSDQLMLIAMYHTILQEFDETPPEEWESEDDKNAADILDHLFSSLDFSGHNMLIIMEDLVLLGL